MTVPIIAGDLATEGIVMPDRFILRWVLGSNCVLVPFDAELEAFEKAGELFDQYGGELEIEMRVNQTSEPSRVYDANWMRRWNRFGRNKVT
jgi:hypothetical protein